MPLSGTVRPEGNKNGALPILAACLLTDEEVRLSNVPRIRDVEIMAELVAHTGADVEWVAQNELVVRADRIERTQLDRELCSRIRASILLAGPLLARCGARSTCRRRAATPSAAAASTRTSSPSAASAPIVVSAHDYRDRARRRPARRAHVPRRAPA